jgi:hypothetical protein
MTMNARRPASSTGISMKISIRSLARNAAALSLVTLAACGGFGSDSIIGGTLSGLATGATVVLSNNGTDNLSLAANGSFVFATKVAASASYSVAVVTQPTGQTCSVSNATGTVNNAGSDINNITVSCVTTASLTVTVTGLAAGASVFLSDGVNTLAFATNGSAAFPGTVAPGATYAVTITTPPLPPHGCTLPPEATGTVPATGLVTVIVTCT